MTYVFEGEKANVDPALWHPLVVQSWAQLAPVLEEQLGVKVAVFEGYRPDARQRWLYGQGRSAVQLAKVGLDPSLSQPSLPIVTNAWSAKTSAHGYVLPMCTADWPDGVPASLALDIMIFDAAGKQWANDAPWDQFVALTEDNGALTQYGLVHFHSAGKAVWDRPHLQRVEWSDAVHNLLV